MVFINEKISSSATGLIKYIWAANRLFDRASDVLKTKFLMYNTESYIHHNMAHFYPAWSDVFVDMLESKNRSVEYPATPSGAEEYEKPVELIDAILSFALSVRDKANELANVCMKEGDFTHFSLVCKELMVYDEKVINPLIKINNIFQVYLNDGKSAVDFDFNFNAIPFE